MCVCVCNSTGVFFFYQFDMKESDLLTYILTYLLTYLYHEAEPFVKRDKSKNIQTIISPASLLSNV